MADDVPEVPVEAPDGSIWVGPTETGAARFGALATLPDASFSATIWRARGEAPR